MRRMSRSSRLQQNHRWVMVIISMLYQWFFASECYQQRPQCLWWVHPMNQLRGLPGKGEFHTQIQELKLYPDRFMGYFTMLMHKYFELLNRIKNNKKVAKQNTNW